MTDDEFYAAMSGFLAQRWAESHPEPLPEPVGPGDNLFDLGLVDSFTIIRMIVFVEELTGRPIELGDHDLETFYTLRGLRAVALGTGAAA